MYMIHTSVQPGRSFTTETEDMVYTAGAAWLGVIGGVAPPVRRIAFGRLRGRESAR
jgi:hypothetical protein